MVPTTTPKAAYLGTATTSMVAGLKQGRHEDAEMEANPPPYRYNPTGLSQAR